MAYFQAGDTIAFVVLEVAPVTGSTTTIAPTFNAVLFTNGSTTAAQTVVLPTNPQHGDMFNISNISAITALTLSPTASGAPAGLAAGGGLQLRYSNTLPGWFVFS